MSYRLTTDKTWDETDGELSRTFEKWGIDVVEAAYRAKAKTAHPDAGGSNERMSEVNEAMDRIRADRAGASK